jgi:hypothetical protein
MTTLPFNALTTPSCTYVVTTNVYFGILSFLLMAVLVLCVGAMCLGEDVQSSNPALRSANRHVHAEQPSNTLLRQSCFFDQTLAVCATSELARALHTNVSVSISTTDYDSCPGPEVS